MILGYDNSQIQVLIPKLNLNMDLWALPSGFIYQDEGIDAAAHRILEERTGFKNIYLDQFRVFGNVPRSNLEIMDKVIPANVEKWGEEVLDTSDIGWLTKRFISIGYYALVEINKVVPKLTEYDQSIDWYPLDKLPPLVMDHKEIVENALEALRLKLDEKLIWYNLLPEKFTMKELQELYETVYNRPYRTNNFQKKMLDLGVLERLEKKFTGAANMAAYLYRFKSNNS